MRHLLREETVHLNLSGNHAGEALAQMVHALPSWSIRSDQKKIVFNRLLEKETYATTAIGGGVALPYCMTSECAFPLASLGISREGIVFPSPDGERVHFIYLLIMPDHEKSHLLLERSLHQLESIFSERFFKERLKISNSPEEAYEIFLREAQHLNANLQTVS